MLSSVALRNANGILLKQFHEYIYFFYFVIINFLSNFGRSEKVFSKNEKNEYDSCESQELKSRK